MGKKYTEEEIFKFDVDELSEKGLRDNQVLKILDVIVYIFGLTPYKYTVDKRTLYKCYRLRKNKELDLNSLFIVFQLLFDLLALCPVKRGS